MPSEEGPDCCDSLMYKLAGSTLIGGLLKCLLSLIEECISREWAHCKRSSNLPQNRVYILYVLLENFQRRRASILSLTGRKSYIIPYIIIRGKRTIFDSSCFELFSGRQYRRKHPFNDAVLIFAGYYHRVIILKGNPNLALDHFGKF